MTPDELRSLADEAKPPQGAAREAEENWVIYNDALNWLEKAAPDLARLCAELGEALEWAVNEWRNTPIGEYRQGLDSARTALAKLAELNMR